MITEDELRILFRNFVKQKAATILLKVKEVSEQNNTCTLENESGLEYFNVRLKATVIGNVGVILYPKVGTFALAIYIEGTNNLHIIHANEYSKMKINCEEISFNNGNNGGLVISKKMTDEFNEIINRINNIVIAILAVGAAVSTSASADVASAITSAFTDIAPNPLLTQIKTNFENSKIKH